MEWIDKAQGEIRAQGLAGWLLYDFRGSNPIAARFLDFGGFITRRVLLFVPAQGRPTLLIHAIERGSLPALPFEIVTYTSRTSLEERLREILPQGEVAMEYSPRGDIPYLSLVDAGTIELVRELGVTPVSSGDLLQVFSAWTPDQIAAHERAAALVYEARDLALEQIARLTAAGTGVTESDVSRTIMAHFEANGVWVDHGPIIGFGPNSGDPHYATRVEGGRALQPGDAILLDIFGKLDEPQAPFADITWMGVYGEASAEFERVFGIVREARDIGVQTIRDAYAAGEYPSGAQVDRAVREHIEAHGFGEAFLHRTGHSLGLTATHGDAVHLDDFETRDTRRLLPGVAVTIEPGVYLPEFGVRSEINVIMTEEGPRVTTEPQRELSVIPAP